MSNQTNPIIRIDMENGDQIRAELYPDIAPKTVENFLKLIQNGFFNGLTFHRVIQGFMIQGGCPDGTGMGGPGWNIVGEFSQNGIDNPLKHARGVLSMARSQDPNSAGSQFFIMTDDSPHLDGAYAAFGNVLDEESLQAVDRIVQSPTGRSELMSGKKPEEIVDAHGVPIPIHQGNADMPLSPIRITTITLES